MKLCKNRLLKGSGILVVIFSAIASSIYMVSTFADYEHFNITSNKYKEQINKIYNERIENIDNYYKVYEEKIQLKNIEYFE